MGHRCNLVVRRAGKAEIHYSHWGALSLLTDLLEGPDALADWLKDWSRERELLDNVWSEGIALVDHDDKVLRVRGGQVIRHLFPLQRAYVAMLREHWPSWRVAWADRGVVEVAEYLGLPAKDLDKKPLARPTEERLAQRTTGPFSWVTVVGRRYVRDFPFRPEPAELLLVGPRLLDHCKGTPGELPVEDHLGGGLLIRSTSRSLGWWSGGPLRVGAARLKALWRGWRVEELPGGLRDQVAGSGRDPARYVLSEERIRRYLADELFPTVQPDPVASMRRLEAKLGPTTGARASQEALKYPRPKRTRRA